MMAKRQNQYAQSRQVKRAPGKMTQTGTKADRTGSHRKTAR